MRVSFSVSISHLRNHKLSKHILCGLSLVASLCLGSEQISAQSIFNEIIENGETVSLPGDSPGGKVILP
jgi:hypothetical protein